MILTTMAFSLDRLDHLVLTVASIDAAVDLYTEVLGMELVLLEGRKNLIFGVQTIKLHHRGHELSPTPPTPCRAPPISVRNSNTARRGHRISERAEDPH